MKYFPAENVFNFQLFLHSKLFFYKHSVLLGQPQYAHDFPKLSLILCLQNMLKFSPWGYSKSTSKHDEFRAYEWPPSKSNWFFFTSIKTLSKWWMFFISSEKLFSILRYLQFCPDFFGYKGKPLDKKVKVNLWRKKLENKKLQ